MIDSNRLAGMFPVFQTPFTDNDAIDHDVLAAEFDWLFEQGSDGLVMAMVSEVLRLDGDEREELAAAACRLCEGKGPAVISIGAESIKIAVRYAKHAQDSGAAAVMAIPPIATALGEDELTRYYAAIFDAIDLPVIVQDASGYVGRPMSIEMQASLLKTYGQRVFYKPEAVPIGPRLSALRDATDGVAKIFEGSGGIMLPDSHHRGIVGTMPGADLIVAQVPLWRALEAGDLDLAYRIYEPLCSLVSLENTLDSYLAIEKHLLVRQGIFKNTHVRGPVGYTLDHETRVEIDRRFDRLMAVVASL